MTKAEAITLLLTPVSKMTDEDLTNFRENREFLNAVSTSREYYRAMEEDAYRKRCTPGGTYTPHLDDHVRYKSGRGKTVCTSAALAFFNIHPDRYKYSGHCEQDNAILRRHGWSVRSRKSRFKISSVPTLGRVRRELRKKGTEPGHYKVSIRLAGNKGYHCIVLDHRGEIVVDTARSDTTNRCKVRDIYLVTRK